MGAPWDPSPPLSLGGKLLIKSRKLHPGQQHLPCVCAWGEGSPQVPKPIGGSGNATCQSCRLEQDHVLGLCSPWSRPDPIPWAAAPALRPALVRAQLPGMASNEPMAGGHLATQIANVTQVQPGEGAF